MVRIVGGRARGVQIQVPKDAPTRPTTDRVRESLFNVLAHRFDDPRRDARVLDLFAGSGALGLEALSRGAEFVHFVDSSRAAIQQIKANARQVNGQYSATQDRAQSFLQGPAKPFDLVFLDPPYDAGLLNPSLVELAARGWLKDGCLLCIECAQNRNVESPEGYSKRFERRYGKTSIIILDFQSEG